MVLERGYESSFLNVVTWNKIDYDSGKVSNIILDTYIKYNLLIQTNTDVYYRYTK